EPMSKKRVGAKHQIDDPEHWVDQYGDYLYRFALSRVKDPSTAEDLVQETLLAALSARNNFQGRSAGRTWFIAILKHKIVDHIRKRVREQASDKVESLSDATENESFDSHFKDNGTWQIRPSKWATNPMKIYEQKEFMDVLYSCLGELPERLAKAFMMREIDGLSTVEICKVLSISATNSWVMLYRARMWLRRCLENKWIRTEE
ncbi:MAG: sigma-70 family RNA polymerase sigma factor, partial [Desulfobacterales bacterium]